MKLVSLHRIIFLFFLVSVLFVSCGQEESFVKKYRNKTSVQKEEEKELFSVNAYARNKEIYVTWNINETYISFTNIKISYKAKDSEDELKSAFDKSYNPKDEENYNPVSGYLISSLENETEYVVNFNAAFDDGSSVEKSFNVVPKEFNVDFDNVTAIIYDKKVHLSLALKEFPENYQSLSVYCDGKKLDLENINVSTAYEEITDQSSSEIDTTPHYSKYCSCVVKDSEYAIPSTFELHAVNTDGTESNSFMIVADKVTLPVVELSLDLNNEDNLEKFINKKKLDATLSVCNYSDSDESAANIENAKLTIKGRGNSSWVSSPKKSYTIKFKKKQTILGMNEGKSFALIANYFDKTLLRNRIAYDLAKNVFTNLEWTPTAKPVNIFINGVYQGVYNFTETNKISKNRINVANLEDCTNADEFENFGYLLEANARADENFNIVTEKGLVWSLKEPDSDDLNATFKSELKQKIVAKLSDMEDAFYSADFEKSTSSNYWKNYIDSASLCDWILISELAKNTDSNMYSSCYMYYKPSEDVTSNGKFFVGPIWDFDLGFGNNDSDDNGEGWKTTGSWTLKNITVDGETIVKIGEAITENQTVTNWISRFLEDDTFKSELSDRWNEKSAEIQTYFADIENSNDYKLNFSRWQVLGKKTYKCPSGYEERTTYESEKQYFSDWVNNRIEWINKNIN